MKHGMSLGIVLAVLASSEGAVAYDGTVSVTPASASAAIAVRLVVDAGQLISGVSWLNNDATTSFESLIVIEATPDAPPDLSAGASVLASVSGPTLDTGMAVLAQPVVTSTGQVFAIFEVPEGVERTAEGRGGGPGIGYILSEDAPDGYLTSDGIAWTQLHPSVELIVSADIALGKGVGVSLASLDPVSLSRSIQDEGAAEALPGPDVRVRPNPFNPTTTIAFSLRAPGHVRVEVFDLRGRLVRVLRDSETAAGRIELDWHGDDTRGSKVGSGVYLVRIVSPDGAWTKRLALAK